MRIFTFSLFVIFLFLTFNVCAQVPNGDFESWNSGEPVGWMTNNDVGIGTKVTQTADAHGGSSALKGEAISYNNNVQGPLIQAGESGEGILISQKYSNLTGYYKLNSSDNDILLIVLGMYSKGKYIGFGTSTFTDASSYTNFVIPIYYAYPDIPDSCLISISITNDTSWVHAGTTFYLDDFTFQGGATSIEKSSQISSYKLYQNYPNPFNPSTKISWQSPVGSWQTLKIYDVLGNEVATLVDEYRPAGVYEVTFDESNTANGIGLSSGVYYYRLKVGDFVSTKKLILLQ